MLRDTDKQILKNTNNLAKYTVLHFRTISNLWKQNWRSTSTISWGFKPRSI